MLAASAYIILCSARNHARVRLRRLRDVRYLLGAIVGVAWLSLNVFNFRRRGSRRRTGAVAAPPMLLATVRAAGPTIGGIVLMVLAAANMLLPLDSGLLDFSEAEVQFLFPAPVSRGSLLLHRLARSQIGILFGSLVIGIATPNLAGYSRLRVSIGMWLILCTWKAYSTAVSLSHAQFRSAEPRNQRLAWIPVGLLAAGVLVVGATLARTMTVDRSTTADDLLARIVAVGSSGLSRLALLPFMSLARPLFAEWPGPYLLALVGSAVVFALVVSWMLACDAAFQEAVGKAADRKASAAAARRSIRYRVRGSPWLLSPVGRDEGAFIWKAAVQTTRIVDPHTVARIGVVVSMLLMVVAASSRANGLTATIATVAAALPIFIVVMGPQALRIDMRQDLRHLELLKTWPLKPAAVVRGQMVWPGIVLTAMAWAAIAVALVMSARIFSRVAFDVRATIALVATVLAPALVFAQLAIHNGAALLFPAWVPLGGQRARGLDAMGQRFILLGATWLVLILLVAPAAVPASIVWFIVRPLLPIGAFVPAAIVGALVIAIEVVVLSELLGPAYERLDLLAVERAE